MANFYSKRLKVLPLKNKLYFPADKCVEYTIPEDDKNPDIGIEDTDLHIYVSFAN